MTDILLYRLYRLRRMLVLGIVPSLATVWAISLYSGQFYPVLAALAVLVPVAHAITYPNNWSETLAVSIVLSVCLALATYNPPELAIRDVFMRAFWLTFLWFVLFLIVINPIATLCNCGPVSDKPFRASKQSRLPAEELRKTLTYYPGREDEKVTCGEADAEGRFPVTIRQVFTPHTYSDDPIPELEEVGISPDGLMETHGHAVINFSGPDHHEVFYFDSENDFVTVCRYSFLDLGPIGTRVVLEEAGTPLTMGQRFGMWVTDFLSDYLTDCIDTAEGRSHRANRAFVHKQLVVDIANIIVPWMNRQGLDDASDDMS